ncbi:copper resistance protein CopC [Actinoplanes sp. TBRC 11911]|nr:copper resistance protein CopC [Actinoplanes sp. TBRC 11911]
MRGRSVLAALATTTATTAALALAPAAPAWAHNSLAEASPARNATVSAAPSEVRLRFLQKLDPASTRVTVTDAAARTVATSKPAIDGATVRVTFGRKPGNGGYTVAYDVTSRDGHQVKGSYRFTVKAAESELTGQEVIAPPLPKHAPTATSSAGATAVLSRAADDEPDRGAGPVAAIAAGVLILAGIGGGLLLRRRRRS